jgi:predicted amidophosphoribosyltransferase
MSEITCKHCRKTFDEGEDYCPYCLTPSPAQQERELSERMKKIILFIVGLSVFCAIMIFWLPR